MPPKTKRLLLGTLIPLLFILIGLSPGQARAGGYYFAGGGYRQNNYYPTNPYWGSPVIIQQRVPVIIERQGSNDYLYEYDNVYGSGASAAGRMSRTVVSPQPQYYIRGF